MRFPRALRKTHVVLSLLFLIVLGYLILVPVFNLVQETVVWGEADTRLSPEAQVGQISLFHWWRIFLSSLSTNMFYIPLMNSLTIAFQTSILSLGIGFMLAWLSVRTNTAFKGLLLDMAMIPYALPSWAFALAWITLFKNQRIGGYSGMLQAITGIEPPDWIAYGALPIVVCLSLHYFTLNYNLISDALSNVNAEIEEAAEITGASRLYILRRIVFPVVTPAIFSAFILTFSHSISSFGAPAFLGMPVRYYVMPTMLYSAVMNRLYGDGYALAVILLGIVLCALFVNRRVIGTRKSFATVGGTGFRRRVTELRRRRIIGAAAVTFLVTICFLPLGVLLLQTFMRYAGTYSIDNLTLHYWIGGSDPKLAYGEPGVLLNSGILAAMKNSLTLAFTTALITSFLGILIGYLIVKGRGSKISSALDSIAYTPAMIPSITFGAIYLSMYARPLGPIPPLYGTFQLLVIACTVKTLPTASRAGVSCVMQLGKELEEAAIMTGASWLRRFRAIILPLTKKGFLSSFTLIFMSVMRELTLIVMLVTTATNLLTNLSVRYAEQGFMQHSDAMVSIICGITLAVVLVARRITGEKVVGE